MSKNTEFSITSAERYSLALFELSEETKLLSQIEKDATSMLNLIHQSNDFSNLVKDPTIKLDDLSNVINTITETIKKTPAKTDAFFNIFLFREALVNQQSFLRFQDQHLFPGQPVSWTALPCHGHQSQ